MRRVCVVAVTVLLLASLAEARRRPAGKIELMVSVPDAEVLVDGVSVGKTPLAEPLTLPAGPHTIKVTRPGHTEFLDVVQVKAGETATLEIELIPLAAAVKVATNPPGANLFIDGQLVGQSPYNADLEPGSHEVRASLDGFTDASKKVDVTAGESYTVDLKLVAILVAHKPAKPIYKKAWFWAATAGAIGATVAIIAVASSGGPLDDADHVITPSW